jgi:hypothetical protein
VPAAAWSFLGGVWDQAQRKVYFNGTLEQSGAGTDPSSSNSPFKLGSNEFGEHLDGLLDEVIVARRWFRDEEIKAVYNKGLNGQALYSPEIVVEQPVGTSLSDGVSTVNFGASLVGTGTNLSVTIRNTGIANLTGLGVTIDGPNAGDFSVIANPAALVLPGGSTNFTVRFTPGGSGTRTAGLRLASTDTDESPFDLALTGTGLTRIEAWRQQYFGTSANSGNAADLADPNANGLPNLLEYALDGIPLAACRTFRP